MNCRSCGTSLPQGVAYCPVCQQPVPYARTNYQGPSFPASQTAQQAGPQVANPWQAAFQPGQAAPHPYGPAFPPAPQAPDAPYPPQPAARPTTENLSHPSFGQAGNQFSPITGNQQWPAPSNSAPATPPRMQSFTYPTTQPPTWASNVSSSSTADTSGRFFMDQALSAPDNLPSGQPIRPDMQPDSQNGQFPAASFPPYTPQLSRRPDAAAGFLSNRPPTGPFPPPIASPAEQERSSGLLPGHSSSGTFPRARALPGTTEKTLGLLSSHSSGRFPASKAQPAPSENASRFLYGPSPASMPGQADPNTSAPFLPGQFPASSFLAAPARPETAARFPYGPSVPGNSSMNSARPTSLNADVPTPINGIPVTNSTGTLEPSHKTQSGHLIPASYGVITSMRKRRSPASLLGLICLVVVLVAGGAFAAVTIANKGFDLTPTSSVMLPANAASVNTTTTGPSGQKVAASATSIIISAQTASTLNENYIPTQLTTSFAANQTIYVSLVINSNNQPGYIMVKWYANKQLVSSDNLAHNPKNTIAFFTRKYSSAAMGNVELYWCTKADCSDAQLARVVNFTVGGAATNATSYSSREPEEV